MVKFTKRYPCLLRRRKQSQNHAYLIKIFLALVFLSAFSFTLTAQIPSTYCDGVPTDWPSISSPIKTQIPIVDVANVSNSTDNQFTGGSQDPDALSDWTWNLGNVNDKTD